MSDYHAFLNSDTAKESQYVIDIIQQLKSGMHFFKVPMIYNRIYEHLVNTTPDPRKHEIVWANRILAAQQTIEHMNAFIQYGLRLPPEVQKKLISNGSISQDASSLTN